jgi:hypothetical protein
MSPPAVPANIDVNNLGQTILNQLPAPVSDFVQKLKTVFQSGTNGTTISGLTSGSGLDLSDASGLWGQVNNWFSSNIGVSLSDIIRAVVNLIIWIWGLIIKLIQVGLSHL